MTRTTLPTDLHAAHLCGLLDRFRLDVMTPPEPGPRGTMAFAYRAGWMSAERALRKNDDGSK